MCGMFDYRDRHKRPLPPSVLAAMAERLRHRGPDNEGICREPERGVAVGNRRLSIIDMFAVAVGGWFRSGRDPWLREQVGSSELLRELFQPAAVAQLLGAHRTGSANNTRELRALALWEQACGG